MTVSEAFLTENWTVTTLENVLHTTTSTTTSTTTTTTSTTTPGELYVGEEMAMSWRASLVCLYAVSSVTGLCGSGLIIFTLIVDDKFRHFSATYTSYLTNLVATDLFFQLYFFPLLAAGLLIGRYPVLGHAHCVLNGFAFFATSIVFMFTLAAISFDRYMFVCHRTKHEKVFSRRKSAGVCVGLWVLACLACVPSAVDGTIGFDSKTHMCFLQHTDTFTSGHAVTVVVVVLSVVGLGAPSVVIFRTYRLSRRRVGLELSSGENAEQSVSSNDIALLRSLLTIFWAFFLLTFPATVAFIIRRSVDVPPSLYGVLIWLYAVNSSTNWIIYGVLSSRFRQGYIRALGKLRAICKASY